MRSFLVVVAFVMSSVGGFENSIDENGNKEAWSNYGAIEYHFEKHAPKEFRKAVTDCLTEWKDSCSGLDFKAGPDVEAFKIPLTSGIIFSFQKSNTPQLLDAVNGGTTQCLTDGSSGTLVQAIIALNGKYYKWHRGAPTLRTSLATVPQFGKVKVYDWSFDYILLHEIGHALGLAHNEKIDSIMYGAVGHKFVSSDDVEGVRNKIKE